jgi:hypothetical protein
MENKKIQELRELGKQLAMAANNFDKLIKVAEAAKELADLCRYDLGHDKLEITNVYQLLQALEQEE